MAMIRASIFLLLVVVGVSWEKRISFGFGGGFSNSSSPGFSIAGIYHPEKGLQMVKSQNGEPVSISSRGLGPNTLDDSNNKECDSSVGNRGLRQDLQNLGRDSILGKIAELLRNSSSVHINV